MKSYSGICSKLERANLILPEEELHIISKNNDNYARDQKFGKHEIVPEDKF